MVATREGGLQYATEQGINDPARVNRWMISHGFKPLTVNEEVRISQGRPVGGNPIIDFTKGGVQNLGNLVSGFTTALSSGARYGFDPNYREVANRNIANYLRGKTGGDIVVDAYNLLANPIGLGTENLKQYTTDPGRALQTTISSIGANPVDAYLLGGGAGLKALGRATKLPTVGDVLETAKAPIAIRQFIPSQNIDKINTAINTARGKITVGTQEIGKQLTDAMNLPGNTGEALRALTMGTEVSGELQPKVDALKKVFDTHQDVLEKSYGIPKNQGSMTAAIQRTLEIVNPNREIPNVDFTTISQALKGDLESIKTLQAVGYGSNQINKLIKEGIKLAEEGKIKPITQRYFYETPESAGLDPRVVAGTGPAAPRRYGWARPEQLTSTIARGYEDSLRSAMSTKAGITSVEDIVNKVGRRVSNKTELASDEVLVSPRAFREAINLDTSKGNLGTLTKRTEDLMRGLTDDVIPKYSDDLFAIKKDYLRPLYNSITAGSYGRLMGAFDTSWKYNALGSPQYITGNRFGNITGRLLLDNNPFRGLADWWNVRPKYEIKGKTIWEKGKYTDLIPKELKAQTSYEGVLGREFAGKSVNEALQKSAQELKDAIANKDWATAFSGMNKVVGSPIMAFEALAETMDRSGAFVKIARDIAKAENKTLEQVLKEASESTEMFNRINNEIKNYFGDYAGRNWNIDPRLYNAMAFAFPFFKFPTQSLRVANYTATNAPQRFIPQIMLPTKLGEQYWNRQTQALGYTPDELGGVAYRDKNSPDLRLQRFTFSPITAGGEFLYNAINRPSNINISPIFGLWNSWNFKNSFGQPMSGPFYKSVGGTTYILDANGNPTGRIMTEPSAKDILQGAGATAANMYVNPIGMWNRWIGPGVSDIVNLVNPNSPFATWYPRYDTSLLGQIGNRRFTNPIYSGKIDSRGRKGVEALTGRVLGNQFTPLYQPRDKANSRQMRQLMRKINKERNRK